MRCMVGLVLMVGIRCSSRSGSVVEWTHRYDEEVEEGLAVGGSALARQRPATMTKTGRAVSDETDEADGNERVWSEWPPT